MTIEMHRVAAYLLIRGERFSPARAETELGIDLGSAKNEPGELATKGSFTGKPTPYGFARWEFSWETGQLLPDSFAPFQVPDLKQRLTALGADEITLYITVGYVGQCNLEMTPSLLSALADLGVSVAISCYEADES